MTETDTFSNQQLSSDSLDPPASMNFERLSPAYKSMLLVSTLTVFVVIVILNLFVNLLSSGSLQALMNSTVGFIVLGATIVVAALGLLLPKLLWRSKGYQLREHDLHFRRGLIWHHVTSLPYVRVQHVELESGPIERYFKLATLKFYTAGGGSADMSIPGLPFGTASKIRSYVMARAGVGEDGSTPVDAEQPSDAQSGPTNDLKDTPTL